MSIESKILKDSKEYPEDASDSKAAEKAEREKGVENVVKFLSKLMGGEQLASPESFINELGRMDYEEFKHILEHLNGLLRKIPIRTSVQNVKEKRGLFKSQVIVSGMAKNLETGEEYKKTSFYFLPPAENEALLREQFGKLQEIAKSDNPDKASHMAQMLYATIVYLHPFADGNGRMGRLSYFMLSPDISKDPDSLKEDIIDAISSRSPGETDSIAKYHRILELGAMSNLLSQEGLELREGQSPPYYQTSHESRGFDDAYINFLAAWRAFTAEEKERYIHKPGIGNSHSFIEESDLDSDVLERLDNEKIQARRDVVHKILEMVNNPNEPYKNYWLQHLKLRFHPAGESDESNAEQ